MPEVSSNKRIAKNTVMLYIRQIVIMAISFYASRAVLQALGEDDFGVYNVVGSVVAMFSLISGSLSAAITRFLTFELGRGDKDKLAVVFSTSVNIQLFLSLIIVILIEAIAPWFISTQMTISPDRIEAAKWVLHFSMATFVINLISVPYTAAIIAHERMGAFAYISMLDAALKLSAVLLLSYLGGDKLINYGWLLLLAAVVIRLIYGIYCNSKFAECRYRFVFNRPLLLEMFAFSGWNFIGASSSILRDQGVNVVLNIFCGTAVNAARGIAMQVNNAIYSLATNVVVASNPQITQSYAKGDSERMMALIFSTSRYCYYLLYAMALPMIVLAPQVLSFWLVEVPDYSASFVRLILIYSLIESISLPLITAMLATGRIKKYQIVVGGIQLLNLPLAYLALYFGGEPQLAFIVAIVLSLGCFISRVLMLRGMIGLNLVKFFKSVIFKVILVTLLSSIVPFALYMYLDVTLISFFVIGFVSVVSVALASYLFGLDSAERHMIKSKIVKR